MACSDSNLSQARTEKRHEAVTRDMRNIETRLSGLENSMSIIIDKLDEMLNKSSIPSPLAPPGLCEIRPSTYDEDDIISRIDTLEKVFLFTDFDVIQDAANRYANKACEPECELSPQKRAPTKATTPDASMNYEINSKHGSSNLQCDLFSIYETLTDAATQTLAENNHNNSAHHQPELYTSSTQTKVRVHGKAAQTEQYIAEKVTDTEIDTLDAEKSINEYFSMKDAGATTEDESCDVIKPCILNQQFVDVLMVNMERHMEERFSARMTKFPLVPFLVQNVT